MWIKSKDSGKGHQSKGNDMTEDDSIRMAWKTGLVIDGNNSGNDDLVAFANLVAAAEREACAKLCDDLDDDIVDGLAGWQFGEAIRARGEQA